MLTKKRLTPVIAEFLGTGILVMVTLILAQTTGVAYFIATSVAVTLGVIYMLFGAISGAHFNPAVTFGMWTARMISTLRAVSYIVAQLAGALVSWQLYQYLIEHKIPAKTVAYNNHILVAEIVGTAILAMGLASAVARGLDSLQSALTYGASFFVGIMIAATASAAYLNPATALGLRSFSAVYVIGPLVGGLVGVNLYMWLFAPKAPKFNFRALKKAFKM